MLVMIKCRIEAAFNFHDALHGFQVVRGMGTAFLKDNIFQHLMVMS